MENDSSHTHLIPGAHGVHAPVVFYHIQDIIVSAEKIIWIRAKAVIHIAHILLKVRPGGLPVPI
jgi:hypothetical protein